MKIVRFDNKGNCQFVWFNWRRFKFETTCWANTVPVLKRLLAKGHEFVLMTSVSPNEVGPAKQRFAEMLAWFVENDIPYIGINENPRCTAIVAKPRLDLIIDDHALGVPLIYDDTLSPRPYVDWKRIEKWFEDCGILDKED